MRSIMTPEHPLWGEFCERLEGPEGCNFTPDLKWTCKGGNDKSFATAILKHMGDIDIPVSIKYFDDHGGHCDCEILFNVDTREQVTE